MAAVPEGDLEAVVALPAVGPPPSEGGAYRLASSPGSFHGWFISLPSAPYTRQGLKWFHSLQKKIAPEFPAQSFSRSGLDRLARGGAEHLFHVLPLGMALMKLLPIHKVAGHIPVVKGIRIGGLGLLVHQLQRDVPPLGVLLQKLLLQAQARSEGSPFG